MANQSGNAKGAGGVDPDAFDQFADALANAAPVKSKLAEVDWNFARCSKAQLPFCLMYEYGRSSPETVLAVQRWRKENFAGADQPVGDNRRLKDREPMGFFPAVP